MSRDIRICGDPVLRRKAKKITEVTDELIELFENMAETMDRSNGVGLAAPQVGESIRAVCVRELADDEESEGTLHCLINPRIIERDGEQEGMEGCLSLPTLYGTVIRNATVVAEAENLSGETVQIEGEGLLARALQHEIDHLKGVLFVDRVDRDTLKWMVPDEDDEDGYRMDPTTFEDSIERFDRLRKARERG